MASNSEKCPKSLACPEFFLSHRERPKPFQNKSFCSHCSDYVWSDEEFQAASNLNEPIGLDVSHNFFVQIRR